MKKFKIVGNIHHMHVAKKGDIITQVGRFSFLGLGWTNQDDPSRDKEIASEISFIICVPEGIEFSFDTEIEEKTKWMNSVLEEVVDSQID